MEVLTTELAHVMASDAVTIQDLFKNIDSATVSNTRGSIVYTAHGVVYTKEREFNFTYSIRVEGSKGMFFKGKSYYIYVDAKIFGVISKYSFIEMVSEDVGSVKEKDAVQAFRGIIRRLDTKIEQLIKTKQAGGKL